MQLFVGAEELEIWNGGRCL